ncbi:hypothetical protein V6N11_032785 [Hibiscus sabdariffa]|uniref:Uncharacterized protein n=1 Tax=Hibiscus sabdariffa TaxID=183260 RepID=A0ABR2T2F9_9ROSI
MGGLFLALLSFDFPSLPALTPVDGRGLLSPLEATLLEPEKQRKAVGVFAMLLENHFAGGLLYISRVVAGEEGDRKNIKWEMHESCTDEETLRAMTFIGSPPSNDQLNRPFDQNRHTEAARYVYLHRILLTSNHRTQEMAGQHFH